MGFGKFLLGGLCAAGTVIAAPVMLPVAALGTMTTGAAFAAGATTFVATSTGMAVGTAAAEKQQEKIDKAYSRGVQAGSEGLENERKAHQNEINAKNTIIEKQEKMIQEQNIYIKDQDEYIDEYINANKEFGKS